MTLLVALRGKDGLVLAADSRGTFGDPRGVTAQNDTQQKLYVFGNYAGVMTAGSGELGAQLMREVQVAIQQRQAVGVTPVMEAIRDTAIQRYDEWFPGWGIQPVPGLAMPVRPDLALIIAGYDLDANGQPTDQKIYTLTSNLAFAPMLHNYGYALQGVPQYALYILNRLYEPGREAAQLERLAAYVITETASQDGKVGGPVQMASILEAGGAVMLSDTRIGSILTRNTQLLADLRGFFYRRRSNP
jgi:20S proteasome alpha/beta subunit